MRATRPAREPFTASRGSGSRAGARRHVGPIGASCTAGCLPLARAFHSRNGAQRPRPRRRRPQSRRGQRAAEMWGGVRARCRSAGHGCHRAAPGQSSGVSVSAMESVTACSNQQIAPALTPPGRCPVSMRDRRSASRPQSRHSASMLRVLPPPTKMASCSRIWPRKSLGVRLKSVRCDGLARHGSPGASSRAVMP